MREGADVPIADILGGRGQLAGTVEIVGAHAGGVEGADVEAVADRVCPAGLRDARRALVAAVFELRGQLTRASQGVVALAAGIIREGKVGGGVRAAGLHDGAGAGVADILL